MAQVRYGKEGQAFPVREGETWQTGHHTFRCGSLMGWTPPRHDLLYSDPPWNDSMVKGFHTKAGLPHPEYGYLEVYRAVIALAGPGVPIWLEGGNKEAPSIAQLLPGPSVRAHHITYYGSKPCSLLYSGAAEPPGDLAVVLPGMDDEHTPDAVLRAYGAGVVLDPCAGRGVTSRAAERQGWASVNNELNPLRVSAALARMAQLNGQEPRRIE